MMIENEFLAEQLIEGSDNSGHIRWGVDMNNVEPASEDNANRDEEEHANTVAVFPNVAQVSRGA